MNSTVDITAVTVTYGRRWELLRKSLRSVLDAGVGNSIVVINGDSGETTPELVRAEFGEKVDVIRLASNTGSANGYKVGIEAAVSRASKFVFLIDDDNTVELDALGVLLDEFGRRTERGESSSKLCLVAFRPEHQVGVARGDLSTAISDEDSFFGFHIKDLASKVAKRLRRNDVEIRLAGSCVRMEVAPYSGMLFHRSVVEEIGTPNSDLVLYADDTEFSYRITENGGQIWLLPHARLTDLESSWNVFSKFGSSFEVWLRGAGDIRAFYASRNQAWFEVHRRPHRKAMRTINKIVYLCALGVLSVVWGKTRRFRMLMTAIRDGEANRLGQHPLYSL